VISEWYAAGEMVYANMPHIAVPPGDEKLGCVDDSSVVSPFVVCLVEDFELPSIESNKKSLLVGNGKILQFPSSVAKAFLGMWLLYSHVRFGFEPS